MPVAFPYEQRLTEHTWLSLAASLLETRLLRRLRFDMGDTYTCSVAANLSLQAPRPFGTIRGHLSIDFTCAPGRAAVRTCLEKAIAALDVLQESPCEAKELGTQV